MKKRIAGVVVLYHPQVSSIENIKTFLPDLDVLYVFDNSPNDCMEVVDKIKELRHTVYMSLGKNVGVAAALNYAANQAIKEGYDLLLTMDQDSYAAPGMVATMLDCAARYDTSWGIIIPFQRIYNAPDINPALDVEVVTVAITSGSLVRLDIFQKIGSFIEKLFIDYVDIEYCLRLQINGYKILRVNKALLFHRIGDLSPRKFFGSIIYPLNHNANRYYFQTRNRFYLRKLYKERFPQYFKEEQRIFCGNIVKMLLYETRRYEKTIKIFQGFFAFLHDDYSTIPDNME